MSMQTDVVASQPLTATGQALNQAGDNILRSRVKALLVIPTATAGTVVLRDGGASGPIIATINTVASATQPQYMLLPGEGLLFRTNIHATIANVGFTTIFYA
jgi:hypothetical protein